MFFNKDLHKFQQQAFNIITFLSFALYFIIASGLSSSAPEYLGTLQSYTKLYVSLFLILRFNPFRRVKFTELDAKIAFSAGMFLLTTTAFEGILKYYLNEIESIFKFN
jgi:hypothetical protein